MKSPTFTEWKIAKLHEHLQACRFAVPKLQRNFVWDGNRAAKLLDSIYRRIPIGSLFLWEMNRQKAHLIRQSSAELLPSYSNTNPHVWFVIDGQQRLSVIHQAFEAQVRQNDSGRHIDFGRLCFVVDPDKEQENPTRVLYRKPIDRQLVPIRDILAPDWKQRMPSQGKGFLIKISNCRARLLSYSLPVVTVKSATLDEIKEVFIRVNSQGMRITSADRAIALMGNLDVRAMAQELRQKVRERFALGSIDPILMGLSLVTERPELNGDPPKLEVMARRLSRRIENDDTEKSNFEKLWHKYQNAFQKAADYLRKPLNVYNEAYLPSANMLATLAVFFFHHTRQPAQLQKLEIRKWFWATGVAERYSGRGYHRNIVGDARFFESLANGKRKRFVFRDLLDPALDIQAQEYSSRSARTRAFFCLLASCGPRYLDNGETISLEHAVVSHANRKHRHHVFPQAQLKNHVSSRVYNSLCNICFLVAEDNQKIGKLLPSRYLAEYRRRQQFVRVMKSHLIPVGPDDGVWDRGVVKAFKKFRQKRLKLICTQFEKEAGLKLFRKS